MFSDLRRFSFQLLVQMSTCLSLSDPAKACDTERGYGTLSGRLRFLLSFAARPIHMYYRAWNTVQAIDCVL